MRRSASALSRGRPRRAVVELGADGYGVTDSEFTTTDPVLAEAVAKRLDRVDPLPCPHDGQTVNITAFSDPRPHVICMWCGDQVDLDAEPGGVLNVGDIVLSESELTELKNEFLDAWHNGRSTWLT